jgi:uridine kinase
MPGPIHEQIADFLCRVKLPHPLRVGIDGIDAAGKTTFSNALAPLLQSRGRTVICASVDGFHNPKAVRYSRGPLSPEGYYYDSFDYAAVKESLLVPLGPGGTRIYLSAAFDFRTNTPVEMKPMVASEDAILLFDGVFLFRPEIVEFWDVKIFIDISFEESAARGGPRDQSLFGTLEAVQARYWERYIPGQRLYFQECQPKKQADIVIDNNNVDKPVIHIQNAGNA